MIYPREIKQDFLCYAEDVWKAEMDAPAVQRSAVTCWLPDYEAFCSFAGGECAEIWGYFDDCEKLLFVVFVEKNCREKAIVHLSVLKKFDLREGAAAICQLRDAHFAIGLKIIDGWILKKNRGLREFIKQIGFIPTELEMMCGVSHGKPLEWQLFQIRRI